MYRAACAVLAASCVFNYDVKDTVEGKGGCNGSRIVEMLVEPIVKKQTDDGGGDKEDQVDQPGRIVVHS